MVSYSTRYGHPSGEVWLHTAYTHVLFSFATDALHSANNEHLEIYAYIDNNLDRTTNMHQVIP